ncbi:uncharacterized mitochondrial protein AtMg00810-like [Rhododendron vialii]|uniref:uncharacterized mitochondrial protein AtMg00810-like n=1 Tax=Rhododendron vialii TaxID=182163 RepID=UPI00265DB7BD|nr:uncharacterized mitochondrial protein AtMg00810-like [Rhododendron vialii]
MVVRLGSFVHEFAIKDLGQLNYFLGVEVHNTDFGLVLCQSKYACELLTKAQMVRCKPISPPMAINVRLDIAYAVNYVRGPIYALSHIGHYQAVKRIIRYVGATMRILRHSSLDLYAFSDADWAGCFITRRSTTGFVRF